jgi:hypothetical protein
MPNIDFDHWIAHELPPSARLNLSALTEDELRLKAILECAFPNGLKHREWSQLLHLMYSVDSAQYGMTFFEIVRNVGLVLDVGYIHLLDKAYRAYPKAPDDAILAWLKARLQACGYYDWLDNGYRFCPALQTYYDAYGELGKYDRKGLRQALRRAEPAIFEDALRFLEDDPYWFDSGYSKELIWRNIRRYPLSGEVIERLYGVALNYLQRPMSREFKPMCLAMAHLGDAAFWQRVKAAAERGDPRAQVNGYCLLAYADGVYAGERERMAQRWVKRSRFYYR